MIAPRHLSSPHVPFWLVKSQKKKRKISYGPVGRATWDGAVDQLWIGCFQVLVSQTHLMELPWEVVLHEHITHCCQLPPHTQNTRSNWYCEEPHTHPERKKKMMLFLIIISMCVRGIGIVNLVIDFFCDFFGKNAYHTREHTHILRMRPKADCNSWNIQIPILI